MFRKITNVKAEEKTGNRPGRFTYTASA